MVEATNRLLVTLFDRITNFRDALARNSTFWRDARKSLPHHRPRLRLEELAARIVPAQYFWNVAAGASGNYETAANWFVNGAQAATAPGPTDSIGFVKARSGDCVVNSSALVNGFDIEPGNASKVTLKAQL